jgi:diguanylate cyclase (GGDEF)-like protein
MKIIITADTEPNLQLLASAIQLLGHTPMPAVDETDVLEKFRFEGPDLIILDLNINGSDGFECARKIHEIDTQYWTPIYFMGDFSDEALLKKLLATGDNDFINKPCSPSVLAAKINIVQRILAIQNQLLETTKKFNALSRIDTLTGVFNRVQFDKVIQQKIESTQQQHSMFALLSIGLDHFKAINDNLGYTIGDLLLKSVAKRLKNCLRLDDFIARMGGDEFNIILDDIENFNIPEEIARKIINALVPPHSLGGSEIHISCSIGITFYPNDGISTETLTQNANIAMSYAKELGRNNFQYFNQELYEKRKQQTNIENALKFAIDREEFFLTYQPIYDLNTLRMVGMEALVCWQHPQLGLISPNIFIPLAEENGLIDAIGKWIIHKAAAQAAKWYLTGYQKFKLAINISPRQLLQMNLPQLFIDIINKTQVPPEILEIELTETAMMAYSNITETIIQKINAIGIGIALDDFGTGYSSLSHLKNMPIETIKIDKSFIENITTHRHDAMIVKSMINLAKNLGLNVIAEGIESAEQLKLLVANGCAQGQGYYLSKPLTTDQITTVLKRQRDENIS